MTPDIESPLNLEKDTPKRPFITTFYSFKGGVGRSTALGMVGLLLAARNRRVVIVDFDLEAPGISILLRPDIDQANKTGREGVLDYLFQRSLTPEENIPKIEDCIEQIDLPFRGELYLVPSGEYEETYIHKLAELDRRTWQSFYKREVNPVKTLIDDLKNYLDPDVILIDARPGFNDTGAIALFDLADMGVICFSPTDQSFEGLRWVVRAARKEYDYQGKPDLRFLLTPMPVVNEELLNALTTKAEDWITEYWGLPDDIGVSELYYKVFYNPGIIALSSLVNTPPNILNDYLAIANTIDASLPDIKPTFSTANASKVKTILQELHFEASRAQEFEAKDIPDIFQRTEDFPIFLENKTWLIRGAKGTGKSLLFRLFVEESEKSKELASSHVNLSKVQFVAAHGAIRLGKTILTGDNLASYEHQVGEDRWSSFWSNYALLQLCSACPELREIPNLDGELVSITEQDSPTQASIVAWLIKRASPQEAPRSIDELNSIDRWLNEKERKIWLLYDELDVGFGFGQDSYARRKRSLETLCAWWLESGISLRSILPKIFIREDIWNQLNFTNKGHYSGKSLGLRWEEADLWRLVLRQALRSSDSLSQVLAEERAVKLETLDRINLEALRQSLYILWGERMGRGKKAYTYNWIRTRIMDGKEICFPRSLIVLLAKAVEKEKDFSAEYGTEVILRPKALIEAFPAVSEQRVDEVRNEYPELGGLLESLRNERSPIDENKLAQIWELEGSELSSRIKEMMGAGILKERSRSQDPPPRVYTIAELYLYGLNMVRKGQR